MDYKTILTHLDCSPRTEARLALSLGLAKAFGASLVGLFAVSKMPMPAYAGARAALEEIYERNYHDSQLASEASFAAAVAARDGVRAEWRASGLDPVGSVCTSARYADLVVLGQRDPDSEIDDGIPADFAERVLLEANRPVLFVPYAGRFDGVGRRVLVAWDAGAEATRAVTAAMPLLARASEVQVVAFDPERRGDHGETACADIGLYLARHGINISIAEQRGSGLDVASQILSRSADQSVDMIVMGAYSHSRFRENLFGGVTRAILETMTVPVLMAH